MAHRVGDRSGARRALRSPCRNPCGCAPDRKWGGSPDRSGERTSRAGIRRPSSLGWYTARTRGRSDTPRDDIATAGPAAGVDPGVRSSAGPATPGWSPPSGRLDRARVRARDIRCLFREQGRRAAVDLLRYALSRIYCSTDQILLCKDLVDADHESALRLEAAGPQHLPQIASFNRSQCKSRLTGSHAVALAHGKRALLAFRGDTLIGHVWWMNADDVADGYRPTPFPLVLGRHDVYAHHFLLAPEHRGGGAATDFLLSIEAELARQGYRRLLGVVDADNWPARWLYSLNGHRVVHEGRTRRLGRRLVLLDRELQVWGGAGVRSVTRLRRRRLAPM